MEITRLNSAFLRSLSNRELYYCFVFFILLLTILIQQNKICIRKLDKMKLVLQLFIVYFSYFKPKYGVFLILLYVTYTLKKYKIEHDNKVKVLQDKLRKTKKEKAPSNKVEKFVETSSCSVCK
jgi:uncharacterized membrane protein